MSLPSAYWEGGGKEGGGGAAAKALELQLPAYHAHLKLEVKQKAS